MFIILYLNSHIKVFTNNLLCRCCSLLEDALLYCREGMPYSNDKIYVHGIMICKWCRPNYSLGRPLFSHFPL